MFHVDFGVSAAAVDPWRAPGSSPATVAPRAVDPWSPSSGAEASALATPSPSFNHSTLTQNIGFTAQSPQNIGMNLPTSHIGFNVQSNGFNGSGAGFNEFATQNQHVASPLGDLDEFDIISNRSKMGASPQPNNGINNNSEC